MEEKTTGSEKVAGRTEASHPDGLKTGKPDPNAVILAYLNIYDSYHSQKELMAYTATALYLGGASALFAQKAFWLTYSSWQLIFLLTLIFLFSLLAFSFVSWQLNLAAQAGDMFKACSKLATQWLTDPPGPAELAEQQFPDPAPRLFDGFVWPGVLVKALQDVRNPPKDPVTEQVLTEPLPQKSRLLAPRVACYCAIWLWAVADLVRVYLTWRKMWPSE